MMKGCQARKNVGYPSSSSGKESTCSAEGPGSIPGSGRSPGEEIGYPRQYCWASLVAQMVKHLPTVWETWVQSLRLGRSPREGKGYPLQYSGLENSMACIVYGVAKSQTGLSNFHTQARRRAIHAQQTRTSCWLSGKRF